MRILNDARNAIAKYDATCLHYNLIAEGVYSARMRFAGPFDPGFTPYIVAGLLGFDMRHMMGKDPYLLEAVSFATKLREALSLIGPMIQDFVGDALDACDFLSHSAELQTAYDYLLKVGPDQKNFHVGATKILHWIAPELFIMLDSNVAQSFHLACGVAFKKGTAPGYSAGKYLACLRIAQAEVKEFGPTNFQSLQRKTPLARLFDKVAFIGVSEERQSSQNGA